MAGPAISIIEQHRCESKIDWVRLYCLGLETKCGPMDTLMEVPVRIFTRGINVGVTHEFKYKMNEYVLNFTETPGLKTFQA